MKLSLVLLSLAMSTLAGCASTPSRSVGPTADASAAPVCPGNSANCDMDVYIGVAGNKLCKVYVDPDTFVIAAGTSANPHSVKLRWTLGKVTSALGWEFADKGIEFIGAGADFNDEGKSSGNKKYQFHNANKAAGSFNYKVTLVNPTFGTTCTSDPTIINQGSALVR